MPAKTLAWIFKQVHSHLVHLRDSNSKVFSPNQFTAPAATIQTLVNRAVCTCLPSQERWLRAYNNDIELCAVRELVLNPSMINNQALAKVNHNYCGPLRQSLISVENAMLILKEPIGRTSSYTLLQLVPRYPFYRIPHQCYGRPFECLSDTSLPLTVVKLAGYVGLCEMNLSGMS
jgi:hypothetical protein